MRTEQHMAPQAPQEAAPLRRRPVTFDDITARGLGIDWPQENCGCSQPFDNDQGVCMACGGAISPSDRA